MSTKRKIDPAIAARVKVGVKHFEDTMGHLPIQMKTMRWSIGGSWSKIENYW